MKIKGISILCVVAAFVCGFSTHAQTSDTESDSTEIDLPFPHGGEDAYNPVEFPGGISLDWPENFQRSENRFKTPKLDQIRLGFIDVLESY